MTREDALNLLEEPRRKAALFRALAEKREEILSHLMPGAPRSDRVQIPREDRTGRIMADLMDLDAEIYEIQRELVDVMIRLFRLLDDDDPGETVLSYYYLCRWDMKSIAKELGYNGNHVYKIRDAGLDHFCSRIK